MYKLSTPHNYESDCDYSLNDPISFWDEVASKYVHWDKKYETVYSGDEVHPDWFKGGMLNTCYNVLDLNIKDSNKKDNIAIIHECSYLNQTSKITYQELYERVCEFSSVLLKLNISKNDIVLFIMPNSIEIVIAMLSCTRIGATFCILFESYLTKVIEERINDLCPKLIISANYGILSNQISQFTPKLIEALSNSNHKPDYIITWNRKEILDLILTKVPKVPNSLDWDELMIQGSKEPFYEYIPVESTHPLYIIYTSGTTGNCKAIVRGNGSHLVSIKYYWDISKCKANNENKVYFSTSFFAWVSNLNLLFSILSFGDTFVVYEGGNFLKEEYLYTFWEIIEKHKVNCAALIPTSIKNIIKYDPHASQISKFNLSSLDVMWVAGEFIDEYLLDFLRDKIKIPIDVVYSQTESGFGLVMSLKDIIPFKPNTSGKQVPSIKISILSDQGIELKNNEIGELAIKLPLPPGFPLSFFKENQNKFINQYFQTFKGYYRSGDLAIKDNQNYIKIISRVDDLITIDGNKIEINKIEQLVIKHPNIADCSIVGIKNGGACETPIGLIVLNDQSSLSSGLSINQLKDEINSIIISNIEQFAILTKIIIVPKLLTTKNGKKTKSIFRFLFNDDNYLIPKTLDDLELIKEIHKLYLDSFK